MNDVQLNPIIIEVCTLEKKMELDDINKTIEECEKKLNMYLEQKKKIFPRFYFVSNQTLIDILSNGNDSLKISEEYLSDLFDGIKRMVPCESNSKSSVKFKGINSKDTETILFCKEFEPKDAVEHWLS